MGTVRNAVIEHVRAKQEESNQAWEDTHHYDEPRLFVSDSGHCPRAAYYNAFGHFEDHPFCVEKTHPFDDYVVEILRAGYVWEKQILQQLGRTRGVELRGSRRLGGRGQRRVAVG